ncbi:hypothetical protein JCM8097_008114 [Rhodosporidiobolus ruineniae]
MSAVHDLADIRAPPAALPSLPVELKCKIAETVYDLRAPFCGLRLGRDVWVNDAEREKQSLARLSRVSKEWHGLCVPWLLKTKESVVTTISALSHLDTLAIRCHRAEQLPYLPPRPGLTTLELNLGDGYPDAHFFRPLSNLRTLFFESTVGDSDHPGVYTLPYLTELYLASTDYHHLRAFSTSPLERLYLRTPGAGFYSSGWERLLQALEAHKDTHKTLVVLESWYCVDSVDVPRAERGVEAVRAACVANGVMATLPKVEKWPWK